MVQASANDRCGRWAMEAIGGHGVAFVRQRHRSPHQHRPLAHAPPDPNHVVRTPPKHKEER